MKHLYVCEICNKSFDEQTDCDKHEYGHFHHMNIYLNPNPQDLVINKNIKVEDVKEYLNRRLIKLKSEELLNDDSKDFINILITLFNSIYWH